MRRLIPALKWIVAMLDTTGTSDDACVDPESANTLTTETFVALIESRPFLRECMARSLRSAISVPVVMFSNLSELDERRGSGSAAIIVLSLIEASNEAWTSALKDLRECASRRPVVMLASTNDAELAREAIQHGAKGYVPVTMSFEIAVAAIRFVLAGGTYAPTDLLLRAGKSAVSPAKTFQQADTLTGRETLVVRAIKQGKSNKAIAYELNMCEGTVKVHVRNVMRKLRAKNRTDVAMRT